MVAPREGGELNGGILKNEEPEGKDRRFALFVEERTKDSLSAREHGGKMMFTVHLFSSLLLYRYCWIFCGHPRTELFRNYISTSISLVGSIYVSIDW